MKNASLQEFEKTLGYICTLCGYPSLSADKLAVTIQFLRDQHGNNTLDDLLKSYTALAAGRIDEKLDNFKSITGMYASRVLQSWLRSQRKDVEKIEYYTDDQGEKKEHSFVNDENKQIIHERFGRWVMFSDELSDEERDYLMKYWTEKNRDLFSQTGKYIYCTVTAYDYYERKGYIKQSGAVFQYWDGTTYQELCQLTTAEHNSKRIMYEDTVQPNRSTWRQFTQPVKFDSANYIKKYVLGEYYKT